MKLNLVTLAFNNWVEVRRTLASVALQTSAPDRYIVIDGSSGPQQDVIEAMSHKAGAEYFWHEPRGVYPAMNEALSELGDEGYVWFINSSDWLASPESISAVREHFRATDDWLVGRLQRFGDRKNPFHPIPDTGSEFVKRLRSGQIGFPHPSVITSLSVIAENGGFDASYRIAADYALSLKISESSPPPRIITDLLAVHDPTGLTSRNRLRNLYEKSQARVRQGSFLWTEFGRVLRTLAYQAQPARGQFDLRNFSQRRILSNGVELPSGWGPLGLSLLDSWPRAAPDTR